MNGSAVNGMSHIPHGSWQPAPASSDFGHAHQQEAAAPWDDAADDGAGFFDDTPVESSGQPHDTHPSGEAMEGREGEVGEGRADSQADETAQASAHGGQAESAWRPEASNSSTSVSPFTALSSEVPSDWYNNHQEVSPHVKQTLCCAWLQLGILNRYTHA